MYKNAEGYPDPTAGAVYKALQKEERRREIDGLTARKGEQQSRERGKKSSDPSST